MDACARESLAIGLRGYSSRECIAALKKVDPEGKFANKEGKVKSRKKENTNVI